VIKLVIFDLDGVLIDAKELHFEALNKALEEVHGIVISKNDHFLYYDGLPTKKKLEILSKKLGVEIKSKDVSKLKQEYTLSMLDSIKENPDLIECFKKIKSLGIKIHVASNSIFKTVVKSLRNLGVLDYVDKISSNEHVSNAKPHPEIYMRSMLESGFSPKDTLIFEDSYVGRKAAHASGGYVAPVKFWMWFCVGNMFIRRYLIYVIQNSKIPQRFNHSFKYRV
jgi:HAD superfamily hydrolase (TIGR01509 family)